VWGCVGSCLSGVSQFSSVFVWIFLVGGRTWFGSGFSP